MRPYTGVYTPRYIEMDIGIVCVYLLDISIHAFNVFIYISICVYWPMLFHLSLIRTIADRFE